MLCLCRADSAPATSRLLLLLSGAVLAALVRPAAGFKPALSALLLGGGRDSGGRHRDAAVVRALPRGWGYTRCNNVAYAWVVVVG